MIYALILYFVLLICGLTSLVIGVYTLYGVGFAYLAGGAAFLILAFFLSRGLKEPEIKQPQQKG